MLIPEQVWREYQRGVDYNNRIDLYDRVKPMKISLLADNGRVSMSQRSTR